MKDENNHIVWHAIEFSDVIEHLDTSEDGISEEEAQQRFEKVGANTLQEEEGTNPLLLLFRQINSPLIFLLLAAAGVSIVADHLTDAAVIVGIVLLNTILGFVQEWRAEGALKALKKMVAPEAKVVREGQTTIIKASEVVPGDVLLLEAGQRISADARLFETKDLHVNESSLTGESETVVKEPGLVETDTPIGDRRNMVWMSTVVTEGQGRGVVVQTGMRTEIGEIAGEVRTTKRESTPLQQRMHRLGIFLGGAGTFFASIVFVLGLLRGYETLEMLLFSVAVAVSAIPEGLPAVITVTLALGVQRMARRNAIIRRLPSVETLGSTTVICTDKTGTITKNQMTVEKLWIHDKTFDVTGEGYEPDGEIQQEGKKLEEMPGALKMLLRIGSLNNNAQMEKEGEEWNVQGDPNELALLVVAHKAGILPEKLREKSERINDIPFSSEKKYMAILHKEESHNRLALVKGAPEKVLTFCSHVLTDDKKVELNDEINQKIHRKLEEFAENALRVMAGAYREFPDDKSALEQNDVEQGLTFVGLWGMIDPPREESKQAVSAACDAGIRPILITGDYAPTALAVARQVGIASDSEVLQARDVENTDKAELARKAMDYGVFARVSPKHKLTIIESLKDDGQIVAMTGDGVNDAPALKGADIGVAMGMAGTEVAKEAADMILTDDNFATIVNAVEEGRKIFANLRRVIFFLLATNLGEILTLGGALLIGLHLPLSAVMILWVNLVTDGACTVPLGVEHGHQDVLKEPPRDPNEPIINRALIFRMLRLTPLMAIGTLSLYAYHHGAKSLVYSQTMAFCCLAAFQWFQALNARSHLKSVFSIGFFSNRWLLLGLAIAILLQVVVVQTRVGAWLFGTTPLSLVDWFTILLVSSSIWIADEIMKLLGLNKNNKQHATCPSFKH